MMETAEFVSNVIVLVTYSDFVTKLGRVLNFRGKFFAIDVAEQATSAGAAEIQ